MAQAQEQTTREYITSLLDKYGMPDNGTIHIVRKGDEDNYKNEPLDTAFLPESAAVLLVPENGQWLDAQGYDKQGYQVFAE